MEHLAWVQPLDLPNGARTRTFASPIRFDGEPPAILRRPPALGEHNDEILGPFRNGVPDSPRDDSRDAPKKDAT